MKIKNSVFILFGLMLFSWAAIAQNDSSHFLANFDDAKAVASKDQKGLLMVFAGSDWCKPCMQFKKEVLLSEKFSTYQMDHLVVLYLDFPAKRKNKLSKEQTQQNEALAEKYNKNGAFPKILLFNSDAALLSEIPYTHQTPNIFISECDKILAGK
jgi:thioredoxin-related protein